MRDFVYTQVKMLSPYFENSLGLGMVSLGIPLDPREGNTKMSCDTFMVVSLIVRYNINKYKRVIYWKNYHSHYTDKKQIGSLIVTNIFREFIRSLLLDKVRFVTHVFEGDLPTYILQVRRVK